MAPEAVPGAEAAAAAHAFAAQPPEHRIAPRFHADVENDHGTWRWFSTTVSAGLAVPSPAERLHHVVEQVLRRVHEAAPRL